MDGLVVLIVLLCSIVGIVNSAKKKPTNKGAGSAQAGTTDAPTPVKKSAGRMPFSREEWARYLKEEMGVQDAPEPAEEPPQRVSKPRVKQPAAPFTSAATAATPAQPGMQGESTTEHAQHLKRIAAEDAAVEEARENARRLRDTNQQKLRTAVVMSEILNKPVSLRPRTGLHR